MNLAPLLDAGPVTKIHAVAALSVFALGALQFAAPKGTILHRAIGWTWVGLMAVMLTSGFFIHDMPYGPFSPKLCEVPGKSLSWMTRCAGIHVVTLGFFLALPFAVLHARRGNVWHHRLSMLLLWAGAGIVGGLFTLDSDRIMHAVVFGP